MADRVVAGDDAGTGGSGRRQARLLVAAEGHHGDERLGIDEFAVRRPTERCAQRYPALRETVEHISGELILTGARVSAARRHRRWAPRLAPA